MAEEAEPQHVGEVEAHRGPEGGKEKKRTNGASAATTIGRKCGGNEKRKKKTPPTTYIATWTKYHSLTPITE